MKEKIFFQKHQIASRLLKFALIFVLSLNIFAQALPSTSFAVESDIWIEETTESVINDLIAIDLPASTSGGNILHAWNMSFNEIMAQLPYIAAAGFNTIQTSPIGESLFQFPYYDGGRPTSPDVRSRIGTWWMLYQPTSFNIGNMLGTEEEFRALTAAAAAYGIGIIVDAIPNHTTSWWNEVDESLRRPELFHAVPGDRTQWDRNISNWSNRAESRRARLVGLVDFYTGNPEFQALYMEFLGQIIDAGATGFRYDAMVHIELPYPHDTRGIASDFWPNIQRFVDERITANGRTPFQYGEILHRWHADYLRALPGMAVTACGYGYHIRNNVIQGRLGNWDATNFHVTGYAGARPDRFVTWVESHDTYGNAGMSRGITDAQMRVGWSIITARAGTTPLFLVRPDSGFVNDGQMFSRNPDGTYTNNWGHNDFFRDPTIMEVNWFANHFIDQPEHTSSHFDQVALIERGPAGATTGVVIINAGNQTRQVNFPVQMVDGEYIDQVSGRTFTVRNGRITGPELLGQTVAVIYGTTPRNTTPTVFANPGSSTFFDADGISVTLGARHTSSQHFTVSGPNGIVTPRTAYHHGDEIVVGYGANHGDEFILTLTGTDGVTVDTQTFIYTKGDAHTGIRIEFAHDAWDLVRIWGWHPDGDNIFTTNWNDAPLMVWEEDVEAWVYTIDSSIQAPFNIMFHNGSGQQLPTGPPYWLIHGSIRIEMVDGNPIFTPIQPRIPQVYADPGSTTFYDVDGVTVTLRAQNTTSQTFMMTDASGLLVVNATPFTNGEQITIGANAFPGDQFTLILTGRNGDMTVTETFVYTRKTAGTRIEFAHDAWNLVRIWGWHPGGGNIFTTNWNNAPLMVWEEDVNAWVFTIDESIHTPFNIMFHNGAGQQLPTRAPYWLIHESMRIEIVNGNPVFIPIQ